MEFIKKIHKLLTKSTYNEVRYNKNLERSGEFKKHDYVTDRNEVGSSVNNVDADMQQLVEEIKSAKKTDSENIIKIAAYFHNVLEQIHPFSDYMVG